MPTAPLTVGLRELKKCLSEYVHLVRDGGHVHVTDRGRVVAELLPPGSITAADRPPGLVRLERRGLLRPGAKNSPQIYSPVRRRRRGERAPRLLDAIRRER